MTGRATRLVAIAAACLVPLVASADPAERPLRLPEGMAGPLSPAEAVASMEPATGWKVELVAAEPLVVDPVAIDWAADGSLWVAEMADYPLGIDPPPGPNQQGRPGGRVRRLRDEDGDGMLDSGGVFLDGIPFPTGVMAWRDGVIVSSAPTVFFVRDTDGDGRGDERIDLFVGFGEGNQQHRINGCRWGLDGWCYLANGDSGGRVRSLTGDRELDLGTRDLRVRPETGEMEVVAGTSQFGRACDDWGHWFGCSNSDPAFALGPDDPALERNRFVTPPAARHRLIDPAQPLFPASPTIARFNYPGSANHFTSACGLEVVRDSLAGVASSGSLVVCEPVHNLVHREALARDGSHVSTRPLDPGGHLLRSRDGWFRPVMARTGPDGGLWIVDMYRAVVEHPAWIPAHVQERIDLRAGDDRGRIWRIVPASIPRRAIPRLDRLTPSELVAQFSSPNGTMRDLAQRTVIERCTHAVRTGRPSEPDPRDVDTFEQALRAATTSAEQAIARATALWTLALIGRIDEPSLAAAFADIDPRMRVQAVAVARRHLDAFPGLVPALVRLAQDAAAADPDLAIHLACGLGGLDRADATAGVAALIVRHREDPAVTSAILAAFDPTRVAGLIAALPALADAGRHVVAPLERMVAATGDLAALDRLVADALGTVGDPPTARQILVLADAAESLQSRALPLVRLVSLTGSSTDADVVRRIVAAARSIARDPASDRATLLAAIRLLGTLHDEDRGVPAADDLSTLAGLTEANRPPDVQRAALDAIVRIPHDITAATLVSAWRSTGPATARGIIDRLIGREPWALALLAALAEGRLPPAAVDAAARQRLLEHRADAVRGRAATTLGARIGARDEVVRRLAHAATLAGDAVRGENVFVSRCATCHRMGQVGHEVGPNIAAVGNRTPVALLEAILDPNRVVEDRYVSYVAVTDDGLQHTGILAGETDATLTLRSQNGQDVTLRRESVEQMVRTGRSLMPEGFEGDLSAQDLADLFAAIGRLGAAPEGTPVETPPRPEPKGLRRL